MLSVENPNVSRAATTGRTDATATALGSAAARAGHPVVGTAPPQTARRSSHTPGDLPHVGRNLVSNHLTDHRTKRLQEASAPTEFEDDERRGVLRLRTCAWTVSEERVCGTSVAENCCCSQTQQRAELRRTPSTGAAIAWTEAWPTLQPARTQAVYQNEKR